MTDDKTSSFDREISIKEVIVIIKDYLKEIGRNKILLILMCVFTLGFQAYKHITHKNLYISKLKFTVEGQDGANSGSLGGLLGSFGIKRGQGLNPYKVLEVGKSPQLLKDVLFSGERPLANEIIQKYELDKVWAEKNPNFENFRFNDFNLDSSDLLEKSAFKRLMKIIWGQEGKRDEALTSFRISEDSGIYTLTSMTVDEDLSLSLTTDFYNEIKYFFEQKAFENQLLSAQILKEKSDSLLNLRNNKIIELAVFQDTNRGVIGAINSTRGAILSQEIQAVSFAYSEILKTYEMTDVNLRDRQPLFMTIEKPFAPLGAKKSFLLMNILTGLFLGLFLGSVIVVVRKVYKDIMEN